MKEQICLGNIYTKESGGSKLNGCSLSIFEGEFVTILGMHGSGKHVLEEVINGRTRINSGKIWLYEKYEAKYNEVIAGRSGILSVNNDKYLVDTLTVSENLYIISQWERGRGFVFHYQNINERAHQLLDSLKIDINPETLVYELSLFEKQLLCIAKAIANHAKMLIFDCVHYDYSFYDIQRLLQLFRYCRKQKISIIVFGEKRLEFIDFCDRVLILRGGKVARIFYSDQIKDINFTNELSENESGRTYDHMLKADCKLSVKGKKGQMVIGYYDMCWNSMWHFTDYLREYMGKNHIKLFSIDWREVSPELIWIDERILYIPEKAEDFLLPNLSVKENILLPFYSKVSNKMCVIKKRLKEYVLSDLINSFIGDKMCEKVSELNMLQRKILMIFRWILLKPEAILLENPFWGLDSIECRLFSDFIYKIAEEGIQIGILSRRLIDLCGVVGKLVCTNQAKIEHVFDFPDYEKVKKIL